MNALYINLAYIAAAVLFVFGLKMLGSPATARRGNLVSSTGMFIAVVVTLASEQILRYEWIAAGVAVGALIGASASRLVKMTSMPEMVALFNGSGGVASLLVGWSALYGGEVSAFTGVVVMLSVLVGGVTASGSVIAWGKLAEVMPSRALVFAGQRFCNGLILAAVIVAGVLFSMSPQPDSWLFFAVLGLAILLGVMAVIPIGGADMPVVISLLNSYSGLRPVRQVSPSTTTS